MFSVFNLSIFGRQHQSPLVCRAQAQALLVEARREAMRQVMNGLDEPLKLRARYAREFDAAMGAVDTCTHAINELNKVEA